MTVIACIGHWYTDLLYLAPVVLMGGLVARDKLRHRHEDAARKNAVPTSGSRETTPVARTSRARQSRRQGAIHDRGV